MTQKSMLTNAFDNLASEKIWRRAVSIYAGHRTRHIKGSGVALDQNHVLTTGHVIEDKSPGDIYVFHPTRHEAARVFEVVAHWPREDIALLRLDRPLRVSNTPVKFASTLDLKSPVLALDITKLDVEEQKQHGAETICHGIYARQRRYMGWSHRAQFEMPMSNGGCGGGIYALKNGHPQLVSIVQGRNLSATKDYGTEITTGLPLSKMKFFIGRVAPELVAA